MTAPVSQRPGPHPGRQEPEALEVGSRAGLGGDPLAQWQLCPGTAGLLSMELSLHVPVYKRGLPPPRMSRGSNEHKVRGEGSRVGSLRPEANSHQEHRQKGPCFPPAPAQNHGKWTRHGVDAREAPASLQTPTCPSPPRSSRQELKGSSRSLPHPQTSGPHPFGTGRCRAGSFRRSG